jgi:MoaA/NifB/PqqE/SkfB family radical SAM enzyme
MALRTLAKHLLRYYYHLLYRPLRPGRRFWCHNIFQGRNSLVFSNGQVTCVSTDHGEVNLGNVNQSSLQEIWQGEGFNRLRESFKANRLPLGRCASCLGFEKVAKSDTQLFQVAPFLTVVQIETTPECNLHCAMCRRDQVKRHRAGTRLTPEVMYRLLDEICTHHSSEIVFFYGYGEPFLDQNIYEYVTYLKTRYPEIYTFLATNGLPLDNDANVEKLLNTPLDVLLFSIDGVNQKQYGKYRRGGDLSRALSALRRVLRQREINAQDHPYVIWQYLCFRWNDSRDSLREALRLARQMKVDLLHFLPAAIPVTGISWKNLFRRRFGTMYKFGHRQHHYEPENRAQVIHVAENQTEIPLPY